VPPEQASSSPENPAALPTIRLGRPLNLQRPSNAALFELLDARARTMRRNSGLKSTDA
jgi:hypothetical protein